jgi:hypothetical protein
MPTNSGNHGVIGIAGANVATFDTSGNWVFPAALTATGVITGASFTIPGAASITSAQNNMLLAGGPSGSVFLNWNSGTGGGGTIFGNGTSTQVAALDLTGHFTAVTKSFQIVHPLDSAKHLTHSCIEGPEIAVYYRGEGQTDASAMATITLPDYFEALTRSEGRSILLTEIFEDDDTELGKLAASRVKDGSFRVRSEFSLQKFYWEVKAVRADVEPLAIETERGEEHEGGIIRD